MDPVGQQTSACKAWRRSSASRLMMDEGMVGRFGEDGRGELPAGVAVDARRIHEEIARDVFRNALLDVCHGGLSPLGVARALRGVSPFARRADTSPCLSFVAAIGLCPPRRRATSCFSWYGLPCSYRRSRSQACAHLDLWRDSRSGLPCSPIWTASVKFPHSAWAAASVVRQPGSFQLRHLARLRRMLDRLLAVPQVVVRARRQQPGEVVQGVTVLRIELHGRGVVLVGLT